jgi:hypothetical protein
MFAKAVFQNCDLPSVNRRLEDPEMFYGSLEPGTIVIFDKGYIDYNGMRS